MARLLAAIVAVLDVLLIYLLLTGLSFLIHYGFPWSIRLPLDSKVEFAALLASCGLALLLPLLTVLVWKRGCWDRLQRVHYAPFARRHCRAVLDILPSVNGGDSYRLDTLAHGMPSVGSTPD